MPEPGIRQTAGNNPVAQRPPTPNDVFKEGNYEISGEVIAWDTSQCKHLTISQIGNALDEAGLDRKYAKDMKPRQAFTRACRELEDKRVIRIVLQDAETVVFQFNRETSDDQTHKVLYPYECNVSLNKKTGQVNAGDEHQALEENIQKLIDRHTEERTSSDVTKIIQAIFQDNGDLFPLVKSKGSAYVSPARQKAYCDKVDAFLTALGGTLLRYPVPKGEDRSLKETVHHGLQNMISELAEVTQQMSETTRESTAKKHIARFTEVRKKMQLYKHYLGDTIDALNSAVSDAETEMKSALGKLFPGLE